VYSLARKSFNRLLWRQLVSWPGKYEPSQLIIRGCDTDCSASFQDEAFELGQQWARVYDSDSTSAKVISNLMDTCYLVNVVHNDFRDANAIFKPFFQAGEEYKASQANAPANGQL
jgi:hypothetical protein